MISLDVISPIEMATKSPVAWGIVAAAVAVAVLLIVVGCKRHKKKKTAAQEAVKNKEADSL